MPAQHLPSLPEDKPGEGISLLSTWGGKGRSGDYQGAAVLLLSLSAEGQQQAKYGELAEA